MLARQFDIFCRVIDNYGDVGVCLRLARQLLAFRHKIRIFTDKPDIFYKIDPAIKSDINLDIYTWQHANSQQAPKNGIVIEAFACEIPDQYQKTIAKQNSLWINLEYLSAEDWITDFHAMPSIQADGSRKYFFFPGFKPNTGGLLREPGLLQQRDTLLQHHKISTIAKISQTETPQLDPDSLFIFLFCYPSAPLQGLLDALSTSKRKICLLLAHGIELPSQPLPSIQLPFISQQEFDQILWASDLNLVRGEDSFIRAIWAGQPMLWQLYEQDNLTHLEKLQAWLKTSNTPESLRKLYLAWNTSDNQATADLLRQALDNLPAWQQHCHTVCTSLSQQNDLVNNLQLFCAEKLGKSRN